jgi:hypothetical protein
MATRRSGYGILAISMAMFAAVPVAGCGGEKFWSRWSGGPVTIDAQNTEWDGAITYFEDEQISVGLQNDDSYLYVALFTEDRAALAQVLTGGFTIWFDPTGKKEKQFGIKYPRTLKEEERRLLLPPPGRGSKPDSLGPVFKDLPKELEIVDPKGGAGHVLKLGEGGIEVAMNLSKGLLAFELKVPFHMTAETPYAIGASEKGTLAVGIETAQMTRPAGRPKGGRGAEGLGGDMGEGDAASGMGGGPGGGGPGGGMGGGPGGGGMGGGPGGGMGGPGGRGPGGPGGRPGASEPLNLWISVLLSTAPASK